jgi:hypothetical protein
MSKTTVLDVHKATSFVANSTMRPEDRIYVMEVIADLWGRVRNSKTSRADSARVLSVEDRGRAVAVEAARIVQLHNQRGDQLARLQIADEIIGLRVALGGDWMKEAHAALGGRQ